MEADKRESCESLTYRTRFHTLNAASGGGAIQGQSLTNFRLTSKPPSAVLSFLSAKPNHQKLQIGNYNHHKRCLVSIFRKQSPRIHYRYILFLWVCLWFLVRQKFLE